jgi:hypothetical protein
MYNPLLDTNLFSVVQSCFSIVEDIHAGVLRVEVPPKTPKQAIRWTPGYIPGAKPTENRSRAYTARNISDLMGLSIPNKQGRWKTTKAAESVVVALDLLAALESGDDLVTRRIQLLLSRKDDLRITQAKRFLESL